MKFILSISLAIAALTSMSQVNPAITHWLINTEGLTGSHYVSGNSTPISDNVQANVQTVQYSNNWVYVSTTGVPAYITGPFLDGNPSLTQNQNAIYKLSLHPIQQTGALDATTGGTIGVFINGVSLFDYRDGVSWNNMSQSEGGGPIPGPPGQGVWNRDAVVAERVGFDCAKGHPAMGNYHHHQNPSAFNLDLLVISDICDLYAADGLYIIDPTQHSPLLGYAADGFPIYGATGYANTDGTGGIARMQSSYQLRQITVRTHYADGTDVADGPAVSSTYPLGRYREDYEFIAHPGDDTYLDEHNGRFCVTPEYPNGIYAYFCTVDANHNSAYPYVVGPTFYGVKTGAKVTSITESVTTYTPGVSAVESVKDESITIYPNPVGDMLAVQCGQLHTSSLQLRIYDLSGKLLRSGQLNQGASAGFLDTRTLYNGEYVLVVDNGQHPITQKFIVQH
jgi:YHYH protein/Secretion system C-terminal sorting domain